MKKKLYFILAVSVFTAGVLAGCGEANTADYNNIVTVTTMAEETGTEVVVTPEVTETLKEHQQSATGAVEESKTVVKSGDAPRVTIAVDKSKTDAKSADEPKVTESVVKETIADDQKNAEQGEDEQAKFDSIEAIQVACATRASCQDSRQECVVNMESDHNPYDVTWDYGDAWNSYVDACDWSLVFDVSYYKKAYPMLAILYNNDDELLLEHFATAGVHEGRQGSKNFNVEAYLKNCSMEVYKAFKGDVEGAYIYYMLHYDVEKNINTVTANNGSEVRTQIFVILTAAQKYEINAINKLRADLGAADLTVTSEMCAFANYRAYLNRINHSGYNEGHNWAANHKDLMFQYLNLTESSGDKLLENTITSHSDMSYKDLVTEYYDSKSHREAMLNPDMTLMGTSNYYRTASDVTSSQIDLFTY